MTSNLLEFYRECVAPDIATGYIRMKEDILQVNNIWDSLNGKTNPSRLVTIRDLADPTLMSTVGCDAGYLPRQTMSMAIAGENKPGWVEGPHWDAMAYEAGVAPRLVRGVLSRMSADLPDAISKIIGDERLLPVERDFLREKVLPVIEERRGFVADAIKSRQSTIGELLTKKEFDPSVAERLTRLS